MSRAVRRSSSWTCSALLLLALTGCGAAWRASFVDHGVGDNEYWTLAAKGEPRAVVVLLHGLGPDSGQQLQPWQVHLAERGYDVIFPRYEQPPPNLNARSTIVGAVRRALGDLGRPHVPLVLIGHSRGGRLAVEAAAFLEPKLVLAYYPGRINVQVEPATNFELIPGDTQIYLFVGDRDTSVGSAGAVELAERLLNFRVSPSQVHAEMIRSTRGFAADHTSVYDLSPAGKRAIWERADRLIEQAVASG